MVDLVTYAPVYADAFARLNYAWIEHYFKIEPEDVKALEHPEIYAIKPGGEIFFTLVDNVPVGTVAMVPFAPGIFELAKMAVDPQFQGRGLSAHLMHACIEFAQSKQAREIMLVTNSRLGPALGLYQKFGFVAQPDYTDVRYVRGNLKMILSLHNSHLFW